MVLLLLQRGYFKQRGSILRWISWFSYGKIMNVNASVKENWDKIFEFTVCTYLFGWNYKKYSNLPKKLKFKTTIYLQIGVHFPSFGSYFSPLLLASLRLIPPTEYNTWWSDVGLRCRVFWSLFRKPVLRPFNK